MPQSHDNTSQAFFHQFPHNIDGFWRNRNFMTIFFKFVFEQTMATIEYTKSALYSNFRLCLISRIQSELHSCCDNQNNPQML